MPKPTYIDSLLVEDASDDLSNKDGLNEEAEVIEGEEGADDAVEGEGDGDGEAEPDAGDGGDVDGDGERVEGKGKGKEKPEQKEQTPAARVAKPGDLLGPNGEVIAKAGMERRIYEKAFNDAKARINPIFGQMNTELENLRGQVKAFNDVASEAKDLGLSPTEQSIGFKLIAAYRKNPGATVNYLLTEAKANGHDIKLGDAAGIDTAAIMGMIKKELAPFTSDRERVTLRTEAENAAVVEYNSFMEANPGAKTHETSIATLMQRFPNLSLESAYLRLENWMLSNGFDTTKPLEPQVAARNAKGGNNSGTARVAPRPLVNGRATPGLTRVADAANGALASPHENYGEIVRRVMRNLAAQ